MISAVSTSFEWTEHQVVKLGGNKGTIYIVPEEKLSKIQKYINLVISTNARVSYNFNISTIWSECGTLPLQTKALTTRPQCTVHQYFLHLRKNLLTQLRLQHYFLTLLLGLPTVQFLIAYSMHKLRGRTCKICMSDINVQLRRQREGRGPNSFEEYLSKRQSSECSQSRKLTTYFSGRRTCTQNVFFRSGTPLFLCLPMQTLTLLT